MSIDWMALARVSAVTLVVSFAIVALTAFAAYCLDKAKDHTDGGAAGSRPTALRATAYAIFTVEAAVVAFGFYLIIPYFH
jgi:hypothetical protein